MQAMGAKLTERQQATAPQQRRDHRPLPGDDHPQREPIHRETHRAPGGERDDDQGPHDRLLSTDQRGVGQRAEQHPHGSSQMEDATRTMVLERDTRKRRQDVHPCKNVHERPCVLKEQTSWSGSSTDVDGNCGQCSLVVVSPHYLHSFKQKTKKNRGTSRIKNLLATFYFIHHSLCSTLPLSFWLLRGKGREKELTMAASHHWVDNELSLSRLCWSMTSKLEW